MPGILIGQQHQKKQNNALFYLGQEHNTKEFIMSMRIRISIDYQACQTQIVVEYNLHFFEA